MTDQLTAAHALLAQFVEQVEILGNLVEQDRPFDLTLESLDQLAADARAIVNADPVIARAAALAETKYGTAAAATVAGLASPASSPAPVASPLPGSTGSDRFWTMQDMYPTGDGADFARLETLTATIEDDIDHYGFTVGVSANDRNEAHEAEADQWFHSRGFLKLSTSDALPAEVMARALAAAYLVVRDAAHARFDDLNKRPADR